MKLPAVVLAAGLLLALLALGLAVRSKALLKDALDVDCAAVRAPAKVWLTSVPATSTWSEPA